jgi:hypothetical protein
VPLEAPAVPVLAVPLVPVLAAPPVAGFPAVPDGEPALPLLPFSSSVPPPHATKRATEAAITTGKPKRDGFIRISVGGNAFAEPNRPRADRLSRPCEPSNRSAQQAGTSHTHRSPGALGGADRVRRWKVAP